VIFYAITGSERYDLLKALSIHALTTYFSDISIASGVIATHPKFQQATGCCGSWNEPFSQRLARKHTNR